MKKSVFKHYASALLALYFILATLLSLNVFAANETIDKCVNLVNVSKNERGSGWEWANKYDTFTMTNMKIDTADDYGLRLPADATVILEGENYIKASKAAVVCAGTTTFKGSGSLTIVSDGMGIFVNCSNSRKTVGIVGGTYAIEAGGDVINSPSVPFTISDCVMSLSSHNGDASNAYSLTINGAVISSDSSFNATYNLTVTDATMSVSSDAPAFASEKGQLIFNKVDMSAGDAANIDVEAYNGENVVTLTGNAPHYTKSILFGDGVHIWVDYVIVIALILLLALVIFLRVYGQKKRDALKKAEIEAIRASVGHL